MIAPAVENHAEVKEQETTWSDEDRHPAPMSLDRASASTATCNEPALAMPRALIDRNCRPEDIVRLAFNDRQVDGREPFCVHVAFFRRPVPMV